MSPREWRLRVEDMIAAIERIEKFTAGQDLAKFTDDEKTFNAVEYNLVIIGLLQEEPN